MLFNSYEFIFLFLPVTIFVFFKIGRLGHANAALSWLVLTSFFFYGWWNPVYLVLILLSIIFNYIFGFILSKKITQDSIVKKSMLTFGVASNICLIGYFKYFNFFAVNANAYAGTNFSIEEIILPLAISFFTFQQITYLVDAYQGKTKEYNFLHYCLFVTFFPQLIAGPIVHHSEMLPQFSNKKIYTFNNRNFTIGLTIFIIGLFKKVVIADNVALYSTPIFDAANDGFVLTFYEAWFGALAYTFQLYFDFSGYSDMAIGLARMFGILLPINFHSPYKAESIIDFWSRWHITLSRFLRDYVYIPMGGNRKGITHRYINLIATMLLGGLWHGAGWTFVIWGGIHGLYLVVNHTWRAITNSLISRDRKKSTLNTIMARSITFFVVVISWVIFRSDNIDSALNLFSSMSGANGIPLPAILKHSLGESNFSLLGIDFYYSELFNRKYFNPNEAILWLLGLMLIVNFVPNTQQIMSRYAPALLTNKWEADTVSKNRIKWQPTTTWVVIISFLAIISLLSLTQVSEFLYFQF